VGRVKPRRPRRKLLLAIAGIAILLFVFGSRGLAIYTSALWFDSLGYSAVFWYIFKLKLVLFLIFFALTFVILQGAFWLVGRAFGGQSFGQRTVFINQQPVSFSPGRVLRPLTWVVSIIAGLVFGFGMRESWRSFALYLHQRRQRNVNLQQAARLFIHTSRLRRPQLVDTLTLIYCACGPAIYAVWP
jgi:uncharacterized membrane protein (UPF0182 family)